MQGIGYRDCCDRWCVYFIITTVLVLSRAIYVNLPSQELSICDSKPDPWWRHQMETFSALLALCAEISPVPVNSPHKGQWRGALMFSLICARINGWVNNSEAGDLRRHRGHYDVIVMQLVQIMYCRLFSAKPISEPILATLGTHFCEILLKIPIFSFLKMCFKIEAILSWPQCVKYIAYMLTLPSISCWRFRVFVSNTSAVKLQACKIIECTPRNKHTLLWRHNEHDGFSNHQPRDCLLNRLFKRRSKETSKLPVSGLCAGNSPGPVNSPHKWPVTRKMFPFFSICYIYRGNDFAVTFVLVWVGNKNIVFFFKFSFQNDGGGKLGFIILLING